MRDIDDCIPAGAFLLEEIYELRRRSTDRREAASMKCLICRLAILDELADAAYDLLYDGYSDEEVLNPSEMIVRGEDFRKVDSILAELLKFEAEA
jgi:hypothetical protein